MIIGSLVAGTDNGDVAGAGDSARGMGTWCTVLVSLPIGALGWPLRRCAAPSLSDERWMAGSEMGEGRIGPSWATGADVDDGALMIGAPSAEAMSLAPGGASDGPVGWTVGGDVELLLRCTGPKDDGCAVAGVGCCRIGSSVEVLVR